MMDFLKRAKELESNLLTDRRFMHKNAELGMNLPITTEYIVKRLKEIGLEPEKIIDSGVTATIKGGKPGKTILLRADMDALPMAEENDLEFCTVTSAAHTCGHDIHAAMLLTAAQMLKENQNELEGNVKLMFQPGEEIFAGAKQMIDAGVMKNPDVDAAFAMHMTTDYPVGTISYGQGFTTSSCDGFKITIHGKGCHGAMPDLGIDPINVGVHTYLAMQNLIAREAPPAETVVLTLGQFAAGTANNIIPETAVLQGTMRTYNVDLRKKLVQRLHEVVDYTAKAFNATVDYEVLSAVPPNHVNPELLDEMLGYINGLDYDFNLVPNVRLTPSDDIAFISELVPLVYVNLGTKVEGNPYPLHNPGVQFDEDVMVLGAAVHAQCTYNWLKNNK